MTTIYVREPWFSFLKSGQKNVEGRLNKGLFNTFNKDDIITWKNGKNTVKTQIISIHHHKNFKSLLEYHHLSNVLPQIKTMAEGINIYNEFYSRADVTKYGTLAIKLKIIR